MIAGMHRAAHRPGLHRRSAIITVYELVRHRRDPRLQPLRRRLRGDGLHLRPASPRARLAPPGRRRARARPDDRRARARRRARRWCSSRLRLEAAFGGRGDRLIPRTPLWAQVLPLLAAAAAARPLWEALRHAVAMPSTLRALIPNVFLFVNYLFVGLFTWRTQIARRPLLGGWSLSGVAMSGVFLTCAFSHLVAGMLTDADPPASRSTTSASPHPSTSCGRCTACTATPRATGTAARWSAAPLRRAVVPPGLSRPV